MPFTHSFRETTPPPRSDGIPWTHVRVEESSDGQEWTEVADLDIAIDATPDEPNPVAITVTTATIELGWFRFRFDVDPSNPSTYSVPVLSPAPPYRPTVEMVAAILRSRTRGTASRDATVAGEQGTFTTQTRPTYVQVQECIDIALGDLLGMMGGRQPCTVNLENAAASSATYLAGHLVEVGYFTEETGEDTTAADALLKLYQASSKTLALSVTQQCPITIGGDLSGLPLGRVPWRDPTSWVTRW